MILISLHNIAKEFPLGSLFSDISWELKTGQKIGFLGVNGVGKTTLLKIMSGDVRPDTGTVAFAKGLRIGRLSQIPDRQLTDTLFRYATGARGDVLALKREISEVQHALADDPENTALVEQLGNVQHEYEVAGGFTLEHEVDRTLAGLGFGRGDYQKPLTDFSGGERTRAELARLLLSEDDVILLDEPTNHLDLTAIEWLEEYIIKSDKTMIIVTHDRVFLDRVASSIVELEPIGLAFYGRGFANYRQEREIRREQQRVLYERQQEEISRIKDFIARNIEGQKTKQAQSRRKKLAKMDKLELPEAERQRMKLTFEAKMTSYRDVLTVRNYGKEIAGRRLLANISFNIERGDRVGFIGPNGCGKTTILRGILGQDEAYDGSINLGNRVVPGYFDQQLEMITEQGSVIDQIWDEHPRFEAYELRSFLAKFLFLGDDVFKSVASLSGGEKSRLALAKLMLSQANFLLLDEPTNHLDIPSREVLEEALTGFEGTLLVVSHDRYFLDRMINKLLVVENGILRAHLGNYSDYMRRRGETRPTQESQPTRPSEAKAEWEDMKQKRRARQKRERRLKEIERRIHHHEKRLLEIDDLLADEVVQVDWQQLAELGNEKALLEGQLEDLYPELEAVSAEIDKEDY